MIARYAGRCALTGAPIKPGDQIAWGAQAWGAVLIQPSPRQHDVADHVDEHMPRHGLGRTRAQVHRSATNARYGAGLDHEAE